MPYFILNIKCSPQVEAIEVLHIHVGEYTLRRRQKITRKRMGELGKEISNLIEDQHTDNEDQNIFNKQEHLDLDPCFRQFQYIYIYVYI